jgi:16S rRNA (adenine(1408)-N(1))-methyltransferase
MEIMRGKQTSFTSALALSEQLMGYEAVHIDLGTGDGRFVQHIAHTDPNRFVIGIDACRDNLHEGSRRAPTNALFVIANVQALPEELSGLARYITINFPWGSLLGGLLTHDAFLLESLQRIAHSQADLEIRLNGGALAEQGWSLEEGTDQVRRVLAANGFSMRPSRLLTREDLRIYPTTWAKRLAFGRDPRAMLLHGTCKGTK